MQKLVRVDTDDWGTGIKIELDEDGIIYEMEQLNPSLEQDEPDDLEMQIWNILDGLDLRRVEKISVLFQGDDVQLNFDPVGEEYRWATAHEWLGYHVSECQDDAKELRRIIEIIGPLADPDGVCNVLFSEMDADGYNDKLHPNCEHCGAVKTLYLTPWGRFCHECKPIIEDAAGLVVEVFDE